MAKIRSIIVNKYLGEAPLGKSFIVPTGSNTVRYVAYVSAYLTAPAKYGTYQCTRNVLLEILKFNQQTKSPIRVVVCAG